MNGTLPLVRNYQRSRAVQPDGAVRFPSVAAGANVLSATKVRGRALKSGTYRVTVQSLDQNGNGRTPVVLKLKITR